MIDARDDPTRVVFVNFSYDPGKLILMPVTSEDMFGHFDVRSLCTDPHHRMGSSQTWMVSNMSPRLGPSLRKSMKTTSMLSLASWMLYLKSYNDLRIRSLEKINGNNRSVQHEASRRPD